MAAGLDGDVKIGLSMNTKSAEQSLSSFRKKLKDEFNGTDTKALDQSIKQTEKTVKQLETQIEKTKQKLRDLSTNDVQPKSVITMEKELAQLEKQLAKADIEFEKLSKEQADLADRQAPGLTIEQSLNPEQLSRFQELDNLIIKNGQDTNVLITRISELKAKLSEVRLNPELTAEGKKYNSELNEATSELNKQKQKLSELKAQQSQINQQTKQQGKHIADNTKKQTKYNKTSASSIPILGTLTRTIKRIGGLIKRVFFFSVITSGLRTLRDGISGLIKSDDKLSKSLSQIKGNLLTAFAPIWEKILPALQKLLNALVVVTAKLAQFTAKLTGTTVEENKKAAESIEQLGEETDKNTKKTLAAFDKLDILTDNNKTDEDKLQASYDALDTTELEKSNTIFDNIKQTLLDIVDVISEGFWDGFGNHDFSDLQSDLVSIKDSLVDIVSDEEVQEAADNLSHNLLYSLGQIVGAVTSIGLSIGENLIGGIEVFLNTRREDIKKDIISMFNITSDIVSIVGDTASAIANIFSALGTQSGQNFTGSLIDLLYNAASGIMKLALLIGRDLLDGITTPIIENQEALKTALITIFDIFTPLIQGVSNMLRSLFDGLAEFWQAGITPAIQLVSSTLSDMLASILDAWNNDVAPSLITSMTTIGDSFSNALGPALQNVLATAGQLVGSIVNAISPLVDAVSVIFQGVVAVAGNILSGLVQAVTPIIDVLIKLFAAALDAIALDFHDLSETINHWAEEVKSFFKPLTKAIQQDFIDVGTVIKDWFENIVEAIETIISPISSLLDNFISKSSSVLSSSNTVSEAQAYNATTFNDTFTIPALAEGAVLPPNEPFIALLSDQKSGTNIEAPADLIKQMTMEAISESGVNNINNQPSREEHYYLNNQQVMSVIHKIINGTTRKYGDNFAR